MTNKENLEQFEEWAIGQLKETIKNGSHVDMEKSFKFELKINYKKKANKTDVSQGFNNTGRG